VNLTFDELIALIFLLPIAVAGLYSLIVTKWIVSTVHEKAQRLLNWLRERKE
jgi:hypothetical protein